MFVRNFLLLSAAAALAMVSSTKLTLHSFEPPFKEVDGAGDRIINKFWRSSGHAGTSRHLPSSSLLSSLLLASLPSSHNSIVVHSNFIRLTPDRQSKRGAIWSTKPLGVDAWSGLLSFRISGHGILHNFFSL